MKRSDNKKNPSSVLGSRAEGGFDSEGAAALYDELAMREHYATDVENSVLNLESGQYYEMPDEFHRLPFDVMEKIVKNLDSASLISVLKASPAWRESAVSDGLVEGLVEPRPSDNMSLQDLIDYIELGSLGAVLPKRVNPAPISEGDKAKPAADDAKNQNPVKLILNNSDELREFAEMVERGKVFPVGKNGEKKNVLDFLGDGPIIRLENDEEYKKSPNPHDVFRDVCNSFAIIRMVTIPGWRGYGSPSWRQDKDRWPTVQLTSAYCLPDLFTNKGFDFISGAEIDNMFIPWFDRKNSGSMSSQEKNLLGKFCFVKNITTPPILVDTHTGFVSSAKEVLQVSFMHAQASLISVLKRANLFGWRSKKESVKPTLVIDPTVVYRASGNGSPVDFDPKREALIDVIKEEVFSSYCYANDMPVRILAPRGARDVPVYDGGLAKNGSFVPAPLPSACAKRWKDLKDQFGKLGMGRKEPIIFDEGFPPDTRGRASLPGSGASRLQASGLGWGR